MKNANTKAPAFPAVPQPEPAPTPQKGPQPNPSLIRFRKADGRFQPARKGQPAVNEEIDDAPGT